MRLLPMLLGLSATMLVLAACASPRSVPAGSAEVTGTVTYRERIAVPPEAELAVRLVDVSLADAPWIVLDEQLSTTDGRQPPFPFTLRYDPEQVRPGRRYAVHAEIRAGDRLMFTTADSHPVDLAAGDPPPLELLLERVASTGPPTAPPAEARTVRYRCPDGYEFLARVEEARATLALGDTTVTLPRAVSASGARFTDGSTLYWSRGDEARLEAGGTVREGCRGEPLEGVEAVWTGARLRGVDFRAAGNEPGWLLEVTEGERIVLETNYGSERQTFGAPGTEMDWTAERTFLRAAADDGRTLEVELERRTCQDTMSGETFPITVTVRWDGAELRGCGRVLA